MFRSGVRKIDADDVANVWVQMAGRYILRNYAIDLLQSVYRGDYQFYAAK